MRYLIVASVSPYPKKNGKQVVLGGIVDFTSGLREPGNSCLVASFEDLPREPEIEAVSLIKPNALQKLLNVFRYTLILRKSIQEALFWNSKNLAILQKAVDEFKPDVVIFDTVRTGQYREHLQLRGARGVLYLDDLFSVRYERMLAAMETYRSAMIDPLGNFGSNVPSFALAIYKRFSFVKRWLLRLEGKLLRKREIELPAKFDLSLLISSEEVAILNKLLPAHVSPVVAISPLIERDRIVPRNWDGRPNFVFLGNLNLAHNGFSIEKFIAGYLDKIVEKVPEFRLNVIGGHASPSLIEMAVQSGGRVELHGFVEDLDSMLSTAAGMIAPLLFGSGVKIKLIDALAAGLPVLSTSVGAEGITAGTRAGIVVSDSFDEYPALIQLLSDKAENESQSAAATMLYNDHYKPESVLRQYRAYLR